MFRFARKWPLPVLAVMAVSTTASAQFKPSRNDQISLGKRTAEDIRKKEKVLPESDIRVKTLRRVGNRILAAIYPPEIASDPKKKDPWVFSFDVVVSEQVNAFALPGGPTFFYTGLLDKMKTEDELAAVIGHELTHVRKEHWATAYNESQRRNIGIGLIALLGVGGKDLPNILGIASELVYDLPFSRRHETEADDLGFEAMVKAGYNPQGMVDTFETLRKVSEGGKPPEFFSTHPDDKNRINRIKEKITKSGAKYPAMTPMNLPKEPKKGTSG